MLGITYLLFFESVEFDYVYNVNDFNKEKLLFLWVSSPPKN